VAEAITCTCCFYPQKDGQAKLTWVFPIWERLLVSVWHWVTWSMQPAMLPLCQTAIFINLKDAALFLSITNGVKIPAGVLVYQSCPFLVPFARFLVVFFMPFWCCSYSMQSRVYETGCPSVCPILWQLHAAAAGFLLWAWRWEILINWCTAYAQQEMWPASLSADTGSSTQTYLSWRSEARHC